MEQVLQALPLELWSSLIFPQLPTQQDRLNCAHTCKTWRAFALQSVESLVVPNVDKKVKRRLPEEHTTEIDFMWHQSVSFRGCAHYEGRGCLKSCGFAGTEERFGLCSKCSVSMHVSSQEELESGLQAWKAQIEYYNQQSFAWHAKKELQTALYDEEWRTCIGELEGTLPLFSSLRQFRCESGAPLLSLDLVASVSSLQCLVLRKVHIEDDDLIKLCDGLPNLVHLDLNNVEKEQKLTDSSISHLSKLTDLRSLELTELNQDVGWTEEALATGIFPLTKLEYLVLQACSNLSEQGVIQLGSLTNLKVLALPLDLTETTIPGLTNLVGLDLAMYYARDEPIMKAIGCFTNLEVLSIFGNLNPEYLHYLACLKKLRVVSIRDGMNREIEHLLKEHLPQLEELVWVHPYGRRKLALHLSELVCCPHPHLTERA